MRNLENPTKQEHLMGLVFSENRVPSMRSTSLKNYAPEEITCMECDEELGTVFMADSTETFYCKECLEKESFVYESCGDLCEERYHRQHKKQDICSACMSDLQTHKHN